MDCYDPEVFGRKSSQLWSLELRALEVVRRVSQSFLKRLPMDKEAVLVLSTNPRFFIANGQNQRKPEPKREAVIFTAVSCVLGRVPCVVSPEGTVQIGVSCAPVSLLLSKFRLPFY